MIELDEEQKKWIERMLKTRGLNEFGDPKGTVYAGGTPLFDEFTGRKRERYEYILDRNREWLPQIKKQP
jgi:hypothetical protein